VPGARAGREKVGGPGPWHESPVSLARQLRRMAAALAISVAVHVALGVAVLGLSLWRGWPALSAPIEIDVSSARVEELHELPLGLAPELPAPPPPEVEEVVAPPPAELPAGGAAAAPPVATLAPAVARPRPRPKPRAEPTPPAPSAAPAAVARGNHAPVKPTSIRSYAPEGSRVVALVRLDRLRDTPYAPAVDGLLQRLPDRRDLLEGTDIDLYRDVDALLVATPNPLDAFATLLVVRHRLSDAQLRSALERGARATRRRLVWRFERGRPFAERLPRDADPPGGPRTAGPGRRDARLILLAAPRLAVVTPPSYRRLLLGKGPPAGDAGDGWASLIGRIDAEDSVLPADAVAMLSASGLSAALGPRTIGVMGGRLPTPDVATAVLGIEPRPFANVELAFDRADGAAEWADAWPGLRREWLSNPIVVLTGFAHLLAGVSVTADGPTLRIHLETTRDETIRILSFLAAEIPLFRR
jgi:hypothetical protein